MLSPMKRQFLLLFAPLALGSLSAGCAGHDGGEELDVLQLALPGNPSCGDGYLDVGEQCDDGNTAAVDGCSTTCALEREMSIAPGSHKLENLQAKCLDVTGVSQSEGADLIEWACHGNDNQRWQFQPWGGGYYALVAKHSGKCAEVSGGSLVRGTKAVQATCGTLPEHRVFRPSPGNGPYFSLVALHSDLCLRAENGKIVQGSCDGSAAASWIQELIGLSFSTGYLPIKNRQDGRCADISGANTSNGGQLIVWPCHGGTNQALELRQTTGGFHNVVLRHSGKCVDVTPSSVLGGVDGQAVRQWTCSSPPTANQEFIAVATDGGYFQLRARHSDMCLDAVPGGINVVQKRCSGAASQQWTR
jgi:cysteine-rich repeat protein